jgi:hypothetical protein
LPSDMVAVGLGFCDGERAGRFTTEMASAGLFPKRTDQDLGQSRVSVYRWAGRIMMTAGGKAGGRFWRAGDSEDRENRGEERRGEGRKKRGRQ